MSHRLGPQRQRFASALRGVLLALAALGSALGWAQSLNDIPMAVKNNVPPNFMFMLDSSGSMLHIVQAAPFDAATTYAASCPAATSGTNNILVPASGTRVDVVISSGVPRASIAGTNRRHTSVTTTGNRVCFINSAVYPAQLVTSGSVGDTTGSYTGNFLNWYFGDYGGHPKTGWPDSGIKPLSPSGSAKSRFQVAKAATISVLNTLPVPTGSAGAQVRVGLSTYTTGGNDGGALKVAMQDLTTSSRATITGTTIPGLASPSGYTPLATTLSDIGRYMATGYNGDIRLPSGTSVNIDTLLKKDGTDTTSTNSCLAGTPVSCSSSTATAAQKPVQQWCQRSYAFMVTDGRPTYDRSFNNNTWLRDYDGDCQGALASSCVSNGAAGAWDRKTARTYEVIGGSVVGSDYLDDVAKLLFDIDLRPDLVAPAGRTKKNNLATYAIGFADEAVKNDPLLISTATKGGGLFLNAADEASLGAAFSRVVTDAFAKDAAAAAVAVANAQITLNNVGYASSYKSGSWYGDLVSYSLDTSTGLQTGADIWSLRDTLREQSPSSRKIVTLSYATSPAGVAFTSRASIGAGAPAALTDGVINYIRGDRTGEGSTYRQRQDVLGDIINAEPVVVTYSGVPIIYQGANDGLLHVVDGRTDSGTATRGQELWAYAPKALHGSLHELAGTSYSHLYYVDGTPAVADVTGVGSVGKLLVGGLGKGGKAYYALDITSYAAATETAAASKVLWEFSPSSLGYSFGTPLIVKVGSNWRVVLPTGYGATAHGIWLVDPASGTGTLIEAPGATGLAHVGKLANAAPDVDTRYVWGGDNVGNVYRFDLVGGTAVRIAKLMDADGVLAQPVTAPPEVGAVSGSTSKYFVYVGSGRYLADTDVPGSSGANAEATQRQSIYGLIDDTAEASPSLPNIRGTNGGTCPAGGGNGDLVCQSLIYASSTNTYSATTHAVNVSTRRGWYVDLPQDARLTNGRVVSKPALTTGGTLTLTVNIPTNVLCDPGGRSWFVAISGANGGGVPINVGGNTYFDVVSFLGHALASRPVLVTTADGKRALIRMSDKTVVAPAVPEPATSNAQWRRIYWRSVR